jgi:hypothetical protein
MFQYMAARHSARKFTRIGRRSLADESVTIRVHGKGAHDMTSTLLAALHQPLTLTETDEIIRNAAHAADGAIEDCEEQPTEVRYFFETGTIGIVSRITGGATIKQQA